MNALNDLLDDLTLAQYRQLVDHVWITGLVRRSTIKQWRKTNGLPVSDVDDDRLPVKDIPGEGRFRLMTAEESMAEHKRIRFIDGEYYVYLGRPTEPK